MKTDPPQFFTQPRREPVVNEATPTPRQIAELNERKVLALESIADRLSGIEHALNEYLPGRIA